MRSLIVAVFFFAAGSVIADPPPILRDQLIAHPGDWQIRTVMPDGSTQRFGAWQTREECEAAIKKTEELNHSYGSECIFNPNRKEN